MPSVYPFLITHPLLKLKVHDKIHKSIGKKKFTYVSLFSGCGGFDLGFSQLGFECAGAIDINKAALAVHADNIVGETYHFDLSSGHLPDGLPSQVDVVIAGSPCQGFSTLGKRKIDDPRNHLLIEGGKAALILKPKVFLAENVLAVKSGAHRQYWDSLEGLLKNAGYKTTEIIIDSRDLGLAQSRRRIFLIAWNTNTVELPSLTKTTPKTLGDVLQNVKGLPNHNPVILEYNSPEYLIAKQIPPGHKLSNVRNGPRSIHTWEIPEVFGIVLEQDKLILTEIIKMRRRIRIRKHGDADPLPLTLANQTFGNSAINRLIKAGYLRYIDGNEPCIDLCYAFNGKYRRLSWNSCATTVDTRFCNPKYHLHPDEHRGLSIREAARLQGFPDDFIFTDTKHDQVLVGNAVPPPVANFLANYVYRVLLK